MLLDSSVTRWWNNVCLGSDAAFCASWSTPRFTAPDPTRKHVRFYRNMPNESSPESNNTLAKKTELVFYSSDLSSPTTKQTNLGRVLLFFQRGRKPFNQFHESSLQTWRKKNHRTESCNADTSIITFFKFSHVLERSPNSFHGFDRNSLLYKIP